MTNKMEVQVREVQVNPTTFIPTLDRAKALLAQQQTTTKRPTAAELLNSKNTILTLSEAGVGAGDTITL